MRPAAPRAELLHVLRSPTTTAPVGSASSYANPKTRTFAELLIDAEEDKYLRAVLVGMLREAEASVSARGLTPRPAGPMTLDV